METIKQYQYRNFEITISRNYIHNRTVVEAAAKTLKQIPILSRYYRELRHSSSGIYVTDSMQQLRGNLKAIRKNPANYNVKIKYLKRHPGQLRTVITEYETTMSVNPLHSKVGLKKIKDSIKSIETDIRSARFTLRSLNTSEVIALHGVRIPVVAGNTRYESPVRRRIRYCQVPGFYLEAMEKNKIRKVFEKSLPETSETHVTVEIEFASLLNADRLGRKLYDAGVANHVELKTDGSVREFPSGYIGHELVVCMPVSQRYTLMYTVLKVLNESGARVNKTCGLHVHLDMRGKDHRKSFNNLVSAQKILYKMVPASRKDGVYSKPTVSKHFDAYRNSSNRYLGINPQSYRKHGTIEVRLHSGTTDYTKITNFVDILIAVGYNDALIARGATTVSGFVKQHKLPGYLGRYINARIALFSGNTQEETA